MTPLKFTGGARIGMSNATWPFATLTVTKEKLELNASILGNYTFMCDDIISIEPYNGFLSSGLKISHKVARYKQNIIFWTFQNPSSIVNEINSIGFFDTGKSSVNQNVLNQVIEKQKQGGFPLKIPFTIGVIVIWNIFFLYDFFNNKLDEIHLGYGAAMALGFVLITSLLLLISKDFRKFSLKEGRELSDISRFLYFIIFICAVMLISIVASTR